MQNLNMKTIMSGIVSVVVLLFVMSIAAAGDVLSVPLAQVKWEPISGMPKGFFTAMLHEEPTTKAHDRLIKIPAGGVVPRHWHTANEAVVVVKGTFRLAGADGKMTALMPGDYAYIPAKTIHEGTCGGKGGCLMYLSIDGAFDMNVVDKQGNPVKT